MALYLQGALLTKTEDYAGADAALTKIGDLLARFPRGYYFQAVDKYNLGQGEQATDAATRFLARNPADPDAIKLFAKIELAARRSTRAIEVLGKAVDSGQADWEMLDLLGRAYVLAGKPDQAMQSLQRAAALAPDNADILMRLASIRMAMGDATNASGDIEHALKIAPNQPDAGAALVTARSRPAISTARPWRSKHCARQQGNSETVGNLTGHDQAGATGPGWRAHHAHRRHNALSQRGGCADQPRPGAGVAGQADGRPAPVDRGAAARPDQRHRARQHGHIAAGR